MSAVEEAKEVGASDRVKSAYRAIYVLEVLADANGLMSFSELQEHTGIPVSSLHFLLKTLVNEEWIQKDPKFKRYGIGPKSLKITAAYLDRDPLVLAASPLMAHLRNELNETVHLARLDGPDVVYLVSQESTHHLRNVSRIGRRVPAYATSLGQVLLSTYSTNQLTRHLPPVLAPLTSETITDVAKLEVELQAIRARGWAYERGQNTAGLACVAVAISNTYPATDALSCSMPVNRVNDELIERVVNALQTCVSDIKSSL